MKKNKHIGTSFESWLEEEGLLEEVTEAAMKKIAEQYENWEPDPREVH